MTNHVLVSIEDSVLRLTLNRPDKKNALTREMYSALADALNNAAGNPDVRAILLGAHGDAFTAGNDLADFGAVASGKLAREELTATLFLDALARTDKPLVAAVQGLAVGIGVTLLLHCDLVYAAQDARLTTPFVNLGLVPEGASSLLLQARIGYARAYAMFALGEPLDGRAAAAMGLVTAALPTAEVQQHALAAAKQLAARPVGALRATKQLMRDPAAIKAIMDRENEIFGARLRSAEVAEALKAFAERRQPNFRDLNE
jgi:enoyl-CoA hydratase/carnithine racemase